MNEIEKDRILAMVAEGRIKPAEGAALLAALAEPPAAPPPPAQKAAAAKSAAPPASRASVMEVDMKRPDGSHHKIEVPSNLFPMFWAIASESIKESTKVAAQETWQGFKNIVRNKTTEVKDGVKTRIASVGSPKRPTETPVIGATAAEERRDEARRQILQMVQNGRLTADDASGLIQQLDALHTYEQQAS